MDQSKSDAGTDSALPHPRSDPESEPATAPNAEPDEQARVLAAEDMREYAIFTLDPKGNVASWNAGAARMKGYRSDEIIGRHFSIFYPAEAVASGYPDWELGQAAEHGFLVDRGWRVRKDGSRFWAHVVITAQRSPEGVLDGFIKITRDESETEARQQRSSRRFTDLFELAPVGIAVFDDSGHLTDANTQLGQLLGYQLQDFFEMEEKDFLHPSDHGGRLFPTPTTSRRDSAADPAAHRVLARSDGQPVLCQVRTAASVHQDGARSWLLAFHDITAQMRYTDNLRQQAMYDDVTGLRNRRGLQESLSEALAARGPGKVGVLFCNLHRFKRVNESLGHQAGDELLTVVAERLRSKLPPSCVPARFYGDQFVIVCSDPAQEGGLEALRQRVEQLLETDVRLRQRVVHVSASVGSITVENPETPIADLMQSAESAMLRARTTGPGAAGLGAAGTPAYDRRESPGPTGTDQLAMEQALREAITEDRVGLHYQPIVGNDGSVLLAEALLRWKHPKLGAIPPNVALDVAQRGGLLADLDRRVLRVALRESADWRTPEGRPVSVSVNLAGLRPEYPGFPEEIRHAIEESNADPEHLVLEMVESVLAELDTDALQDMRQVVENGVRFAMDDFGRGYSSLARLRVLPTQIVKLDAMFVAGLGSDATDLGIARTVAELARTTGRSCVAEGVENATQHHLLRAIGVDAYQGFLFSPALAPDDFRRFLGHSPRSMPTL